MNSLMIGYSVSNKSKEKKVRNHKSRDDNDDINIECIPEKNKINRYRLLVSAPICEELISHHPIIQQGKSWLT